MLLHAAWTLFSLGSFLPTQAPLTVSCCALRASPTPRFSCLPWLFSALFTLPQISLILGLLRLARVVNAVDNFKWLPADSHRIILAHAALAHAGNLRPH